MSIYQFKTDGVSKRYTVPFATGFISGITGGAVVQGDAIVFPSVPVADQLVNVTYTLPTASTGGITPAQLDLLVSDPELVASQGSILAGQAAVQAAVIAGQTSVQTAVLAGQASSQATLLAGQAASQTVVVAGQTSILSGQTSAKNAIIAEVDNQSALVALSVNSARDTILAAVAGAGAYSGKVDLVNRASGLASAGWTKAGGLAVPDSFFNYLRTVVLPYQQGSSGVSSYSITYGNRAMVGDKAFINASLALRSFDFGSGAWATLSSMQNVGFNATPTSFGTVNGKLFASGYQVGAVIYPSVQTYDPATSAWSIRASLPGGYRGFSGVADIGNAQIALFGGKSVSENTSVSASNMVNECRVYNESTNTFTSKTALPCFMAYVRTAVRPDAKVFLVPSVTSDGTTLASSSRRVFLWDATTGTVELDALPAEVSVSPLLLQARADGTLVYVPLTVPSSGLRARLLTPSAAAGSQWTGIDWDYNDLMTYVGPPTGCESKASTSGFALTGITLSTLGNVGLTATYVATQGANWSQSFYQIKN